MAAPTVRESIFSPETRGLTIAVMACVGIIAYNNLAVAAALPEVGSDLGNVALLPWTISAELLTSGVAILAAGPLVDSLGPRRVFRWSVVAFILTSMACGIAPSMVGLVGARALQGVAAGLLFTVTMTVIGLSYETDRRARVFAANSIVWGVMSVAGPSVAALMVAVVDWRGVFFFNVIWSWLKGEKAGKNPWKANSLEWTTESPPPHGNWPVDELPTVYRGPYEYGHPDREEDYWPQNEPA